MQFGSVKLYIMLSLMLLTVTLVDNYCKFI